MSKETDELLVDIFLAPLENGFSLTEAKNAAPRTLWEMKQKLALGYRD